MDNETTPHYAAQGDSSINRLTNNKKIRVGIMLDTYHVAAWYYNILDIITRSDYASLELVILTIPPNEKTSYTDKIRADPKTFFYHTYTELENRLLRREPDAFAPMDARKLLQNVPVIEIKPKKRYLF